MKIVIYLLCLLFSLSLMANEDKTVNTDAFKVNKDEVRKSLENLKKGGQISNADYMKALKELDEMDDKKLNALQDKAVNTIMTNPEEAQKMIESVKKK